MIRRPLRFIFLILLTLYVCGSIFGDVAGDKKQAINAKMLYIHSILMPITQKSWTEEAIAELNSFTRSDVIKKEGLKPIVVITSDQLYDSGLAGLAIEMAGVCLAIVSDSLLESKEIFQEVAIHEILHCYGYGHSTDPDDVMYFEVSATQKTKSYKNYARDLFRIIQ